MRASAAKLVAAHDISRAVQYPNSKSHAVDPLEHRLTLKSVSTLKGLKSHLTTADPIVSRNQQCNDDEKRKVNLQVLQTMR